VGFMSYVKIVIDNRGNRIILPHTTWKAFIERRANVERLVQSTVSSSLTIQDLIVELVKIGNEYNVKISLHGTCLHQKPFFLCLYLNIVSNMYTLNCVNILTVLRNLNILWLFYL